MVWRHIRELQGGYGADGVLAVCQLEVGVGSVIVAGHRVTACVQHQRGVKADVTGAVDGDEALVPTGAAGIVAVDHLEVAVCTVDAAGHRDA